MSEQKPPTYPGHQGPGIYKQPPGTPQPRPEPSKTPPPPDTRPGKH